MDSEQQPQNPPADPENAKDMEEDKDADADNEEEVDLNLDITIEEIVDNLQENYPDPIENYEKVFHQAFIDEEEQKRIDANEENKEPNEAETFAAELGIEEELEKQRKRKKLYFKRNFENGKIIIVRGAPSSEDQDFNELELMTTAAELREFTLRSVGVHGDMASVAGGDGPDLLTLQDEIIRLYKDYKDFIDRIRKIDPTVNQDAPRADEDAKDDGQKVITFEDIVKQDGEFFQEHKKSMKENEDVFCKALCKITSNNKDQLKAAFEKKKECEDEDTQNYLKIHAALTCTFEKHKEVYNQLIENEDVQQEDIVRINYKQTLRDQTLSEAKAVGGKIDEYEEELKRKEKDYEEKQSKLYAIKDNVIQTVHSLKNKTVQIVRILDPHYKYSFIIKLDL